MVLVLGDEFELGTALGNNTMNSVVGILLTKELGTELVVVIGPSLSLLLGFGLSKLGF
jgi:hypothetical protein